MPRRNSAVQFRKARHASKRRPKDADPRLSKDARVRFPEAYQI